jgi:hexokinase
VTANRLNTGEGCDLGFTFSFPVEQTAIASGILVKWTKGFNVKGVLRKDVVGFLNAALADEGLGSIKVAALVNDTVGTLMARSYEDTYCDAGMIVGTGTNACYLEKSAAISKWKGPRPQAEYTIVNTEWGNFDKLRRTAYDKTLDEISDRPGEQILEKMVSGLYLGEITRLILKDLAKRQVLSGRGSSSRLAEKWVLKSEYMSAIESDRTAALRETANILAELGVRNTTKYDREFVRMICHLISLRAARLIAAALGAVVTKMDPDLRGRHTVAVDGAVYERHPQFANDIRRALRELFGKKGLGIKPVLTKDGSGKGAAIAAAVTVCAERR